MARRKPKAVVVRGKRKEAIARASVKAGKGTIRINGFTLEAYFPDPFMRAMVEEVLDFLGKKVQKVDIDVNVEGGGIMGQLQAVRTAIARGVVAYYGDEKLENALYEFDPYLIKEDPRRVEMKKDRAKKARAKYQKSYR